VKMFLSSTALEAMEEALAVEQKENHFLLELRKLAMEHGDFQVVLAYLCSVTMCEQQATTRWVSEDNCRQPYHTVVVGKFEAPV